MEELPATGLTKAIGVANLSIKKLSEVLVYAKIVPCLNQVRSYCGIMKSFQLFAKSLSVGRLLCFALHRL